MAGPSTQLEPAWSTLAATTTIKMGHNATNRALKPMPMTAEAAARLTDRTASTIAPPAEQADQAPDCENKTNIGQRPLLGCQIDREKWAKTGLDVGNEKSEPIEGA